MLLMRVRFTVQKENKKKGNKSRGRQMNDAIGYMFPLRARGTTPPTPFAGQM